MSDPNNAGTVPQSLTMLPETSKTVPEGQWVLTGPAGTVYSSIADAASTYISNYLPDWKTRYYMLPPAFPYKFTEPWGKADGAVKKVGPEGEDKSMHLIYAAIEFFLSEENVPAVVFNSFTMKNKIDLVKHFYPFLECQDQGYDYIESDLLIFSPQLGLIAIEVKGTAGRTAKRRANQKLKKARDGQLSSKLIRPFLRLLLDHAGIGPDKFPIRRIVAFPLRNRAGFSDEQLVEDGDVNSYLFADDFKDNCSEQQVSSGEAKNEDCNQTEADVAIRSGLCRTLAGFLVPKPYCSNCEALLCVLVSIWSLTAVKSVTATQRAAELSPSLSSLAASIRETNLRVKEQQLVLSNQKQRSVIVRSGEDSVLMLDLFNRIFFLTPQQRLVLDGPRFQLIYGPAGTGKSILLTAAAAERIRNGRTVAIIAPDNMAIHYGLWKEANQLSDESCLVLSFLQLNHILSTEAEDAVEQKSAEKSMVLPTTTAAAPTTAADAVHAVAKEIAQFLVRRWRHTNTMKEFTGGFRDRVPPRCYGQMSPEKCVDFLRSLDREVDKDSLRRLTHEGLSSYDESCKRLIQNALSRHIAGRDVFIDDALCIQLPGKLHEWAFLSGLGTALKSSDRTMWLACDLTQNGADAFGLNTIHDQALMPLEKFDDDLQRMLCHPRNHSLENAETFQSVVKEAGFKMSDIVRQLSFPLYLGLLLNAFPSDYPVKVIGLKTVLRCSRRAFDLWHSTLFNQDFRTTVEQTKCPEMQLYRNVLCGHQIQGPEVRKHYITRKPGSDAAAFNEIAGILSSEVSSILSQCVAMRDKQVRPRDFAVLLRIFSDEQKKQIADSWLRAECGQTVGLCTIAEQLSGCDAIALDSVSSAISLEWPVVVYVDNAQLVRTSPYQLVLKTGFMSMDEYFALSRARGMLVVIRIESAPYSAQPKSHNDNTLITTNIN